MAMTLRRFRSTVLRWRGKRRRGAPRYPTALREFAVAHGQAVAGQGGSISRAARELGLSDMTLSSWMRSGVKLRAVQVSASTAACSPGSDGATARLTVTTPSGHAVTGLTVEQAGELLRVLG